MCEFREKRVILKTPGFAQKVEKFGILKNPGFVQKVEKFGILKNPGFAQNPCLEKGGGVGPSPHCLLT